MATLGGGESGRSNLHCLPKEGPLQQSFPLSVSVGGRRRLHLSSGMGDGQSQICQGGNCFKIVYRKHLLIAGGDDGEAGGVPRKRHRGVGVDIYQCVSSHLQNVRLCQTSTEFVDRKVRVLNDNL